MIIRSQSKDCVYIPHSLIKDERFSLKELGLLAYLFIKPDNWEFDVETLSQKSPDTKKDLRAVLKGLENKGFLASIRPDCWRKTDKFNEFK